MTTVAGFFEKIIGFLKNHKKFAVAVVLAIPLIFGVTQFINRNGEEVTTSKATKNDLSSVISATGKTKSEKQVNLRFQASGRLVWVGVNEGEEVKKWQAIASLDVRDIEKNLKKKLLDYMNERWDFEQDQDDYSVGGRTLDKVLLSTAEKRILEKAQFDLDNAVLDVEIKDLARKLATIVSPIEGILASADAPIAGINVTPATSIFVVADPNLMIFVANVDETDIAKITVGQKVIITLDAHEEEFDGLVQKIDFTAITTKGGGTAFPIEVTLPDNEDLRFRIGMNGDASIIIEEKSDVLSVPNSAIWQRKEVSYVWKVVKGKTVKQEIQLGLETDEDTEIIKGLTEGDVVVSKNVSKIKEGQKIK